MLRTELDRCNETILRNLGYSRFRLHGHKLEQSGRVGGEEAVPLRHETLVSEGLAVAWTRDGQHRDRLVEVEQVARRDNVECLW